MIGRLDLLSLRWEVAEVEAEEAQSELSSEMFPLAFRKTGGLTKVEGEKSTVRGWVNIFNFVSGMALRLLEKRLAVGGSGGQRY